MASNIRAISTGYKITTEAWTLYSTNASFRYPQLPNSVIGKNIIYALVTTKGSSNFVTVIYNGTNCVAYYSSTIYTTGITLNLETGIIETSHGLWNSNTVIRYSLVVYY